MLFDANRHVDDFDLLHDAGCTVGVFEFDAAHRARLQRVFPSVVEQLERKAGTLVFRMSSLTTRFSFPLAIPLGRLLRIDDIAGRRLGGVRRILFELRDPCFEVGNELLEPLAFRALVVFFLRRHNSG